jgi:hypothetical protein
MIVEYADRFDVAQGLYWYCVDFHGGQGSDEYRILSILGYNPSPSERGPTTEDGQRTYDALRGKLISLEDAIIHVNPEGR